MGVRTPASQARLFPETFVPPLENGDRLTRAEFERRYDAMPEHVRAELVEGVVIMASPVRFTFHAQQHYQLIGWTAPTTPPFDSISTTNRSQTSASSSTRLEAGWLGSTQRVTSMARPSLSRK